ncbi:hypothetical protein GQF61_17460 [Sphingobacterium sp. DK4209]|uniref:Uncharacterized protein n=1 Tax=Sphingobacterium zhuxiongii TaxID=2662364 RepID=A0A5Q0QDA7_9SPHI|nr:MULTISPECIES: hypothetical protein [unclassified Sphingobacterium]MVZ67637.1 hypothetical protein [Sphingobacterium sp. DK4209]QGA27209.1 hypothetical protein GFH32_13215 [Sphingobacterium sp. dk4302]
MENTTVERPAKHTDNNANRTEYYVSLTIAIVIGLIGVFIRFVPDVITSLNQLGSVFSWIANIAVLVAAFLAFKVVFAILGFSKK